MIRFRCDFAKTRGDVEILEDDAPIEVKKLLSKLEGKGGTEEELYNLWNESGTTLDDSAYFFYFLQKLHHHSLLFYSVFLNESPLATLIPTGNFHLKKINSDQKFRLSRFSLLRMNEGRLVLETSLAAAEIYIENQIVLELLYALSENKTLSQLSNSIPYLPQETLLSLVTLLDSASCLDIGEESSSLTMWEFHDLLFHSRSRKGRHANPYGGTFRFLGKIPPAAPLRPRGTDALISLYKPESISGGISFDKVIDKRKSIRNQGRDPITIQQLGEFLYRSARVKEVKKGEKYDTTTRLFPGGGACYELELYPVIYKCQGIEPGFYRYYPDIHALSLVAKWSAQVEQLLKDAQRAARMNEMPQVLITLSARFARVNWKYQSVAYAVILKNVGTLMQTFYLTATAMDLAPSSIGGGNSDLFSQIAGTDYYEESSVGEFILGSK